MVFRQNGEAYQKKVKQEFKGHPSNHADDTPASTRQQVSNTKRMAVIIYPRYNTCCDWSIIVLLVFSANVLSSLYWKQQNLKMVSAFYGSRKSPCSPHQGFLGNPMGSLKLNFLKGKSDGLSLGRRGGSNQNDPSWEELSGIDIFFNNTLHLWAWPMAKISFLS